jgi:hypothetical protein
MKSLVPACSSTFVNPNTREWVPHSFDDFLRELQHLEEQYNTEDRLLVFRGHRKSEWLLDSTFVRSCKMVLFGLKEHDRFSTRLGGSLNLHLALLNMNSKNLAKSIRGSNS